MANSCNGCGLCCALFLINLTKAEYQSGNYKTMFETKDSPQNFNQAQDCGANLLAKKPDGSCIYLKGTQCSIHDNRPKACRNFFCTSKAGRFSNMVKIIKKADRAKISSMHL